jgi:adenylate cyclase
MLDQIMFRLGGLAASPGDGDELRHKKAVVIAAVFLLNVCANIVYGAAYSFFHEWLAGLAYWAVAAASLTGLLLFYYRRLSYHGFGLVIMTLGLGGPFAAAVILGGFQQSGGVMLFGLNASLGALILLGPQSARRWFVAYLVLLGLSILLPPYLRQTNHLPALFVSIISVANLIGVSVSVFTEISYYIGRLDRTSHLLRDEQQKAERLLLNILPKDVANLLKNEPRTIADCFSEASILFADVVNFTPLSARLTPVELVELLNEVFSCFDLLVEKYGLEKIKTIGDCYMVAAGVPAPRPDHAHALAALALDMRDYTLGHAFRGEHMTFRMGLNSGPVVAGVIGRRKFVYDLWGDAVNTASRMESHGAGGLVQITAATYELIKDDFVCEPRGVVNVKGKGNMQVWHVIAKRV